MKEVEVISTTTTSVPIFSTSTTLQSPMITYEDLQFEDTSPVSTTVQVVELGFEWNEPETTTAAVLLPVAIIPKYHEIKSTTTTESPYNSDDCGPLYSKCRRYPFF